MVSLWLASQSPRRASMIKEAFPDAHCQGLEGVDETPSASGTVAEKVASICRAKADAIPSDHGYDIVLVCDTVLADPDELNALMGKPHDAVHAATMLHRLSGRRHQVWSAAGVCVHGHWSFFTEYAVVEIDELADEVLVDLVLNESWKGKAGGYVQKILQMAAHVEEDSTIVPPQYLRVLRDVLEAVLPILRGRNERR